MTETETTPADIRLNSVSTRDLYAVCATLECAHEHDQLLIAQDALKQWGVTQIEATQELMNREKR